MEIPFCLDSLNLGLRYFWDMFREISFIDGLHVSPVVLDSDFFEFGLILIVPSSEAPPLFFSEGAGAGYCGFAAVAHLDIHGDIALVGDFSVALYDKEVFLVFARCGCGEVAAFELTFAELIEEGEWDVFVLFVLKLPVYPLAFLYFKVLEDAEVDIH